VSATPDRPAGGRAGETALTVGVHLLLIALGVLLAIYGAFLVPRGPRLGGHVLSLGVVIAVVGNLVAGLLGGRAAGHFGGIGPFAGWLITAFVLSSKRPSGSLVLPGGGDLGVDALLFLLLGAVAGAIAAAAAGGRGSGLRRRP
jgi:hypothetical protein